MAASKSIENPNLDSNCLGHCATCSNNGSDAKSMFYNYLTSVSNTEIFKNLNFNYYTPEEFNKHCDSTISNIEISIFHLNIRSLNKNSEELFQLMQSINLNFDVIVLSEIWAYNINLYHNLFEGYTFYCDLPVSGYVGGVGIYIKNTIAQNQLDTVKLKTDENCKVENIWVEISKNKQKYIIGGLYRHPGQDIEQFTNKIEKMFLQLKKMNLPCLIAGDINIDLAKYDTHNPTTSYLENILLHNIVPTIVMPTRFTDQSATIIDHIYFWPGRNTDHDLSIHSGNFWTDLSDHLPNFCFLMRSNTRHEKKVYPLVRIYSDANIHKFKENLKK